MIDIKNVSYKHILHSIHLHADAGDIMAIVGKSGAGKSTLLRLISRMITPTTGTITSPKNTPHNIGFVYQNAVDALSPSRTILAQMCEVTDSKTALKILDSLGIKQLAHSYGALISGGQQMRAILAINIAMSPAVLLLDEATANLDDTNTNMILDWVRAYVQKTNAVVLWVTHNRYIVSNIATKVIQLDNGHITYTGTPTEFLTTHNIQVPLYPLLQKTAPDCVAELQNVTVVYNKKTLLDRFSLQVNRGEIIGLYGKSGQGKTTILRTLLGQIAIQSGSVTPPQSVQIIFQDARNALNPSWTVYKSLYEAVPKSDKPAAKQHIYNMAQQVGIDIHRLSDKPHTFSGGECQRLCIARAFLAKPDVILADEMTSALDLGTRTDILRLVQNLQNHTHTAFVCVSHSKDTLNSVCNRIIQL